ncbi:unnamed protein product [Rangifer tarandus platyrhynchus]|uniref:Uncharacterized protein n=1 Tax=Rangifer tarandus platyrhynchus TaxID=3082113 RepID=A0AC59ZGE3_RANTA
MEYNGALAGKNPLSPESSRASWSALGERKASGGQVRRADTELLNQQLLTVPSQRENELLHFKGALLLGGCIGKGSRLAVPVLIIGILVFLRGFYHLHIAYYASKGYWGHSYDEVPDFDD